jgi:hypothetical protein
MAKLKTCKVCKVKFEPKRALQSVCGIDCAKQHASYQSIKAIAKKQLEERKQVKEKLKTRSDWMKEAQTAFNSYIRQRDDKSPCISCGRHHSGQYHAGHYLSVGARPELRFNEDNVHKQCSTCNTHLHGNLILYRANLIDKIGKEMVEWLEGPHNIQKYTADDLAKIKKKYKEKLKQLQKSD